MKQTFEKLKAGFLAFNKYQQAAVIALVIAIPLSITLGVSALNDYNKAKQTQGAGSIAPVESSSSNITSSSSSQSESSSKGPVEVTLHASSVEEDLEVQIIDSDGELIVGTEFTLNIKSDKGSYKKDWKVDDGFLKLTKLTGGDYTVTISPVEGFVMPEPLKCTVVKKVAYEKVDVSDKIVDDSKVDSSKEDSAFGSGSGSTQTPPPIVDTVEFVESKTEVVNKEVEKIVVKYKPNLMADGTIKTPAGISSGLYPELDSKGFLTGAYSLRAVVQQNNSTSSLATSPLSLRMTIPSSSMYRIMNLTVDEESSSSEAVIPTPEPTTEPTPTPEPTTTPTPTPEPTATPTPTPEPTATPTPTPDPTAAPTPTSTPTPSSSTSTSPSPTTTTVPITIFYANRNIVTNNPSKPITSSN